MTKRFLPTNTRKSAGGYDNKALVQETIGLAQQGPVRESVGKVWKSGDASPLAPILEELPNFRVLIVDDNRPIRQLVRSLLLAFGVRNVDEAGSGVDAIRRINADIPDIVITDLEMSPMNGLEFTRQVRESPLSPKPDLPIIVMTAHTERQRIVEVLKAGLTEVMAKPITPKLLARNILTAMDRYQEQVVGKKQPKDSTSQAPKERKQSDVPAEDSSDFFI
jgi:two-component system chemotaxis response regulator CheY